MNQHPHHHYPDHPHLHPYPSAGMPLTRQMSTNANAVVSPSGSNRDACPQCARSLDKAWRKVNVTKKKLEIEKEKLSLDQEILKAEKKKFKCSNKLAASASQEAETMLVSQMQIQVLELQKELSRQQQQDPSLLHHTQSQLTATQQSLAALFVERDQLAQKNHDLQQQLDKAREEATLPLPTVNNEDEVNSLKESLELAETRWVSAQTKWQQEMETAYLEIKELKQNNIQLQKSQGGGCNDDESSMISIDKAESNDRVSLLEAQLQDLQFEHDQLQAGHLQLKEEAPTSGSRSLESETIASMDGDSAVSLKSENQQLKTQVQELTHQVEDLQLLLPRNKLLLEQALAKNTKLEEQVQMLEGISKEQGELVDEIQQTKEALMKQREKDRVEISEMKKENKKLNQQLHGELPVEPMETEVISDNNQEEASKLLGPLPIIIPSDPEARNLQFNPDHEHMKHVIEWEWTGEGTGLTGFYTGWVNLQGQPNGHGTLRILDGSIYDGEWRNGTRHGHGVYTSIDGDLFRGSWKDDKHHGRGVYVWPDGQVYTGDYVDGVRHGTGIETWPHGARYEGAYEQDQRNGSGTYHYPDGRCYSGEYKDDRPNGHGTQTSSDGAVLYDGDWSMGEFLGG